MLKRGKGSAWGGACLVAAVCSGVAAAEWERTAGVTPARIYTDNVCLSPDNEQDEWVGTVTPDIALRGEGSRASLDIAAMVEINSLSDSRLEDLGCAGGAGLGNRDQFAPRLRAGAHTTVVEDWAGVDASATIDQNKISPFLPGGNDGLNRNGNTNTTYRYSVSPYVARRFKDVASLLLRYTWDEETNSADVVGDSQQQHVELALDSGPASQPFSWGVQGDYDEIDYTQTRGRAEQRSELSSARVTAGYQIDRVWQVNGYYGEEWNDFVSSRDDIDGSFWDVGLRWTPNRRTTVEVGTGDRFFGSTPRFSVSHRHKRSVLEASYRRDLTYDRNIRSRDDFLPAQDEFGNPIDPATGQPVDLSGNETTLTNSPILDERFTLSYVYQGRRARLRLYGSHSDQTRAEEGSESTFQDYGISLNRQLSRVFGAHGDLSWSRQEPKNTIGPVTTLESDTWRLRLGVDRQLGNNLNVFANYEFTDRQSDTRSNEYQENRFTVSLRYTF